LKQNGLRKYPN